MKLNFENAAIQVLSWIATIAGAFIALVLLGVFAKGAVLSFCLGYGC